MHLQSELNKMVPFAMTRKKMTTFYQNNYQKTLDNILLGQDIRSPNTSGKCSFKQDQNHIYGPWALEWLNKAKWKIGISTHLI